MGSEVDLPVTLYVLFLVVSLITISSLWQICSFHTLCYCRCWRDIRFSTGWSSQLG